MTENGSLKAKATVTADGINETIESNTVELLSEVANEVIKVSQTTNIQNSINDQDTVEFYIDIENNSQKEQTLLVEDSVQKELKVNNGKASIACIAVIIVLALALAVFALSVPAYLGLNVNSNLFAFGIIDKSIF
jgi:hypothetical protein